MSYRLRPDGGSDGSRDNGEGHDHGITSCGSAGPADLGWVEAHGRRNGRATTSGGTCKAKRVAVKGHDHVVQSNDGVG
jgi:hypothetical protein